MRFARAAAVFSLLSALPLAAQEGQTSGIFDTEVTEAEVVEDDVQSSDGAIFLKGLYAKRCDPGAQLALEGCQRTIQSPAPVTASKLAIRLTYTAHQEGLGFGEVFACNAEAECGSVIPNSLATRNFARVPFGFGPDDRHALYDRTEGTARAVVNIPNWRASSAAPERSQPQIKLQLLKTEGALATLEPITADHIGAAFDSDEGAGINCMESASGCAELLAAADLVLADMAASLTARPAAEAPLLCDTDNVESWEFNRDLADRPAFAKETALAARFVVDPGLLVAHDMGFFAPNALNTTGDGRARHRQIAMMLR